MNTKYHYRHDTRKARVISSDGEKEETSENGLLCATHDEDAENEMQPGESCTGYSVPQAYGWLNEEDVLFRDREARGMLCMRSTGEIRPDSVGLRTTLPTGLNAGVSCRRRVGAIAW